jgi:hypothetical protein
VERAAIWEGSLLDLPNKETISLGPRVHDRADVSATQPLGYCGEGAHCEGVAVLEAEELTDGAVTRERVVVEDVK